MLHEARSSELLATQRLADCHGRVHTLELMRLHGMLPHDHCIMCAGYVSESVHVVAKMCEACA